jgi:hypothetical protein
MTEKAQCTTGLDRPLELRESIQYDLSQAEARVIRLKELLTLLEAHPEVNRIMELLANR